MDEQFEYWWKAKVDDRVGPPEDSVTRHFIKEISKEAFAAGQQAQREEHERITDELNVQCRGHSHPTLESLAECQRRTAAIRRGGA